MKSHLDDLFTRVLLATIRDKGLFPCVRCHVAKNDLDRLGQQHDMKIRLRIREYMGQKVKDARDWIYKKGRGIKSQAVENLLKPYSLVPTEVRDIL